MRGPVRQRVGEHLSLVPFAIPRPVEQREALAVSLDVEQQIQQRPMTLEFLYVTAVEFGPSLRLVAVPGAQLSARSDVPQPQIELSHGMAQTPWPKTIDEHAISVPRRGLVVDALHKGAHSCHSSRVGSGRSS